MFPRLTSSFWKSPDSKLDTAAMVQSCQSHTKHTQPNGWPEPQKNDEHDEIQLEAWYILGTQYQDQGQGEQRNAGKKRRCCGFNLSTESTGRAASCQHLRYPLGKWWNNMEQGVAKPQPLELHNLTGHNEYQHLEDSNQNERCFRPWMPPGASEPKPRHTGPHISKNHSVFLHHIHTTWSFHGHFIRNFCQSTEFAPPNRLCAHVPGQATKRGLSRTHFSALI